MPALPVLHDDVEQSVSSDINGLRAKASPAGDAHSAPTRVGALSTTRIAKLMEEAEGPHSGVRPSDSVTESGERELPSVARDEDDALFEPTSVVGTDLHAIARAATVSQPVSEPASEPAPEPAPSASMSCAAPTVYVDPFPSSEVRALAESISDELPEYMRERESGIAADRMLLERLVVTSVGAVTIASAVVWWLFS